MKEYNISEKIKKVNNEKHIVVIPEKHSNIKALILETRDLNAWDDWANITNYHTLCMVLKKGEKEWETLHDGSTHTFKINGVYAKGVGILNVLFLLETEKVRNNFIKKTEITNLKNRIKKDSKRLKKLQEGKK